MCVCGGEGIIVERNKNRSRFNWFVAALIVITVYFSYTFIEQQIHLNALNRDYEAAQARLEAARIRNAELKEQRAGLEDPAYIEKVAREDLGMTRQGEMPYISAHR